jgi:hypothetical protein
MYAAGRWPTMNHKGRLRELAKELTRWTERRVRAVYNAEDGVSLRAEEATDIEALNRKIEEANRNEFQDLQDRIARLEAALFAQDEEFHSEQVAGYRQGLHGGRGTDVAGPAQQEGE